MFKSLTTAVLAAALAFSLPAAPARADSGETARALIGIATLAIIAGAAAKKDKDNRKVEVHRNDPPPRYNEWEWRHGQRLALPAACAMQVRGYDGYRNTVLSAKCLQETRGVSMRKLPRDCAFDVRIRHRQETVYGQRCLERNGYRIEARRY